MCKNFVNVNFFLPKLGADGFPPQLQEDYLKVVIGRDTWLSAGIKNTNELVGPGVPEWMTIKTILGRKLYFAYIRTKDHHFSTITFFNLDRGQYPTNQIPTEAFLRFKGNERFEATRFKPYYINQPHTDSDFGDYGRVYVSYPNGLIFSALLKRKQPRARSVALKRPTGCCSFFPGGRK